MFEINVNNVRIKELENVNEMKHLLLQTTPDFGQLHTSERFSTFQKYKKIHWSD